MPTVLASPGGRSTILVIIRESRQYPLISVWDACAISYYTCLQSYLDGSSLAYNF